MSITIQRWLEDGPPDEARIAALIEAHEFPLAEGQSVTFVYRGPGEDVRLRHFIYGLPSSQPFQRVEETDFWYLVQEIPPRSRVEYKIERTVSGEREWIMDPLNPRIARDPFGANSVCHGEDYEIAEWCLPDEEARPGTMKQMRVRSAALERTQRVKIYLPARFRRKRRYPLLVVHDGTDYERYSSLRTVLDNLIHRLEIPPLIAALIDPGDRLTEYAADASHARHVVEELLPELERTLPVIPRPDARALLGASFGAVAALSTAWMYPGVFGRLCLQSGSFAFFDIGNHARGPAFDPVARFVNEFREAPGRPTEKIFISCGMYESLIYENRSLVPLLQDSGMDVRYVESRDGHNWENWRDRLREGLSWIFPGPLWMVYE